MSPRRKKERSPPTRSNVLRLRADHPLVGSWVVADRLSSVEFRITATASGFAVAARDTSDGEVFQVDGVRREGHALRFTVRVPSNGTRVEHALRVRRDGTLEDEYTARYTDVLVRKGKSGGWP